MINFTKETSIYDLVKELYENCDQSTNHFILGKHSKSAPTRPKKEVIDKLLLFIGLLCTNTARLTNHYFLQLTE